MKALLLLLALTATACREPPAPAPPGSAVEPRQLGSWSGRGDKTLGFVSESGSFRIAWTTRNEAADRPGTFRLTLRSGISGRPIRLVADHRGDGAGDLEFGDDPRMYEFLVESAGIGWSIAVEETFAR